MKLKIAGFVENVRPYDVRIVAEGEGASVDLFVERARIKKRTRIKKFPIELESRADRE